VKIAHKMTGGREMYGTILIATLSQMIAQWMTATLRVKPEKILAAPRVALMGMVETADPVAVVVVAVDRIT